jgi:hypothetical protein
LLPERARNRTHGSIAKGSVQHTWQKKVEICHSRLAVHIFLALEYRAARLVLFNGVLAPD